MPRKTNKELQDQVKALKAQLAKLKPAADGKPGKHRFWVVADPVNGTLDGVCTSLDDAEQRAAERQGYKVYPLTIDE